MHKLGSKLTGLLKNCVYISLFCQIVPEMLFVDAIFFFVHPKIWFLVCACPIPKDAVVSLHHFIHDANMLVRRL